MTKANRPFKLDILLDWLGLLLRHSIVSVSRLIVNVAAFEESIAWTCDAGVRFLFRS